MTPADSPAARQATRLSFWVAGFGVACWAPLVPFTKQRLQVDDGTLGLLLLCLGIGSVVAMLRTGPLCARHGCRPVVLASAVCMLLLLPTLVLANTVWQMALALLAFGAALGSLDVAMNVHAVEVERGTGRPLMSGFHALFSVGGFMGSALMTLLLALAVSPLLGTLLCSTLMAAAMLPTRSRLLVTPRSTTHGVSMVLPRGPVLLLSLLAAVTFLVEGALLDWSALLLTESGLALAEHAGLGYAVFAAAMTAGRFSGDAASARFGDRAVMFWGGVVAVAGFVLVLLPRSLPLTLPGFALVGLGASNIVPVLFRKAGSQSAMPAAVAVSAITTIGYAGYLLGPAALGYISKLAGVAAAFWLLAGLMGLVPIFARQATGAATTVADPAP